MKKLAWPLCVLALLSGGCSGSPPGEAATTPVVAGSAVTAGQGSPTDAVNLAKVAGNPKENEILRLEVTEAGFFPASKPASAGRRYYTCLLYTSDAADEL